MIIYTPSKTEAVSILKSFGYCLKKDNGEFEVYPKGKRGDASYFTTCIRDAIATARTDASNRFAESLAGLPINTEIADALRQWHKTYGIEWRDTLHNAWITGNYGSHAVSNVSSYLQRLRNTNGHVILEMIKG